MLILLLAGMLFLSIAGPGQISGKIDPGKGGHIAAGGFGSVFVLIGLVMPR